VRSNRPRLRSSPDAPQHAEQNRAALLWQKVAADWNRRPRAARRSRAVSERTRNVAQLRCSYGECYSREIIAIETP
jgi:hypothetical protein